MPDKTVSEEIERRAHEIAQGLAQGIADKKIAEAKAEQERADFVDKVNGFEARIEALEDGIETRDKRIADLEESDGKQQLVLDAFGKGYAEVSAGMKEVTDGQLLAPAKRAMMYYGSGGFAGGAALYELVLKRLIAMIGG